MAYKVAVVGVTGMVGQVMLQVLDEMKFPISELIPVASESSVGKEVEFQERSYRIKSMLEAIQSKPQIALFSAGGSTSLEWAPKFAAEACYVIDNSSAWRMDPQVSLVVPEVNESALKEGSFIIANPNCSTIQMVVAINPIHRKYGIKRIVVSTYQSFTGTGMKAVRQYEAERDGKSVPEPRAYHHPIFENCIPHCDLFLENGYTKEEMKLVHETRKIMSAPEIKVSSTAVRVPVYGGHSESVNLELSQAYEIDELRQLLKSSPGLCVLDDPDSYAYPTPQYARHKNEVFVGRLRRDESLENGLNLWVTADNLRKGAATNAVQIALKIRDLGWIG